MIEIDFISKKEVKLKNNYHSKNLKKLPQLNGSLQSLFEDKNMSI
jgi:hypothetical protein